MLNLYETIRKDPGFYRQLNCREELVTIYNCPLEKKMQDMWSKYNYVAYVMEGRKVWHTAQGSYDLRKGTSVFVRKGACIVEQFFDTEFCVILFFLPDEFICDTLKTKSAPLHPSRKKYDPVISLDINDPLQAYFRSVLPYFDPRFVPDQSLLELKFRELVLTIADNPCNSEVLAYFHSLVQEPRAVSLQRVMEDNFSYNLKLEAFAQLSHRSLSAFKRDFEKIYHTTPGKWLLEKRLNHSLHLLTHGGKTVAEAAFESGFENPSHFSRAFRQHFGKPPAALKQQTTV